MGLDGKPGRIPLEVLTPAMMSEEIGLPPGTVGALTTGLALTLVAMVSAWAFAVAVRRRLAQLGMLGAVGATPSQISRLIRPETASLAVAGAGTGAVLGVLVPRVLPPLGVLVQGRLEAPPPPDVGVFDVLAPALLGVVAGVVAAWLPARTAGRVAVVAAL